MEKYLKKNIKGKKYEQLINRISASTTMFSFVTREDVGISQNSVNLIDELTDFLITSYPTNQWLSNEIIDSPTIGHIYFYELNSKTINIILEVSNSLFDWGDDALTDLPEDIAFYNKNKCPILYVNGHENYAVIEISSLKEYIKIVFL